MSTLHNGYIECALWASTDDDGDSLDHLEPSTACRAQLAADVDAFEAAARETCPEALDAYLEEFDASRLGHDFWLTRNHHGAGFWDRGMGAHGEALTKLAHFFGEADLYVHPETWEVEHS